MDSLERAKRYSDAHKAAEEALQNLCKAKDLLYEVNNNIRSDIQGIAEAIMREQRDMMESFYYIEKSAEMRLLAYVTTTLREKRTLVDVSDCEEARDYIFLQSLKPN